MEWATKTIESKLGHPTSVYETDEFRMYAFKIKRCAKTKSHDWTECPYAHRGEKARRRDPRKFNYSGVACPEFRHAGDCRRGQRCEFAHGVFEFWLHPARYRTRACKAGPRCLRKVCFFAHSPEQLRMLEEEGGRGGSCWDLVEGMNGLRVWDGVGGCGGGGGEGVEEEEEWPDFEWVNELVE
ncbi:Zinc finger CCCH domain-containing protein 54 [Acorus calamus]|uniref:Zinc finger CCCH domain-containing protein 54 n=1 Tax=Acorus calamus TaxID=4465 RepID=A0AAV9E168_ACOCL|nr:Zinc finger CCCH domain-containing protein 54 [Acorus calamus]